MRKILLLLAWLPCMGHGRRLQAANEKLPSSPFPSRKARLAKVNPLPSASNPNDAVAALLLGMKPAAAFNALNIPSMGSKPMASAARGRLSHRIPVMAESSPMQDSSTNDEECESQFGNWLLQNTEKRIENSQLTGELDGEGEQKLWKHAALMAKDTLGEGHVDTLRFKEMWITSRASELPGEWRDTLKELKGLVKTRTEVQGHNHPDTLHSMEELASILENHGDTKAGADLRREIADAETWEPEADSREQEQWEEGEDDEEYFDDEVDPEDIQTFEEQWGVAQASRFSDRTKLAAFKLQHTSPVEAEKLYKSHVEIISRYFGKFHPWSMWLKERLLDMIGISAPSRSMKEWGKFAQRARDMEKTFRDVVEYTVSKFGAENEKAISNRINLANFIVERRQGQDLQEAQSLHLEVLKDRTRALGQRHPDTLYSKRVLANTLQLLGNTAGARKLLRDTVDASVQVLGADHPQTLWTKYELASISLEGNEKAGQTQLQEVFDAWTRTKGPKHPGTCVAKAQLAGDPLDKKIIELLERGPGDTWADREAMVDEISRLAMVTPDKNLRRATRYYKFRMNNFGPAHPNTATDTHSLARAIQRYDQNISLALHHDVLKFNLQSRGPSHFDTLGSMARIAGVLKTMGQYTESEQLLRDILQIRIRAHGLDSPSTLDCQQALVRHLIHADDLKSAKDLQRDLVDAMTRVKGAHNPGTAEAKKVLAKILIAQGDLLGAEVLRREVLDDIEFVLGPEHPETIEAKLKLASTLGKLGKFQAAIDLQQEVLEVQEQTIGLEHPDIMWTKYKMSKNLFQLGEFTSAEEMQREVLQAGTEFYGAIHPETLRFKKKLGETLQAQSKEEDADVILQEIEEENQNREDHLKLQELLEAKGYNTFQQVPTYTVTKVKKDVVSPKLNSKAIKILRAWSKSRKPKEEVDFEEEETALQSSV